MENYLMIPVKAFRITMMKNALSVTVSAQGFLMDLNDYVRTHPGLFSDSDAATVNRAIATVQKSCKEGEVLMVSDCACVTIGSAPYGTTVEVDALGGLRILAANHGLNQPGADSAAMVDGLNTIADRCMRD